MQDLFLARWNKNVKESGETWIQQSVSNTYAPFLVKGRNHTLDIELRDFKLKICIILQNHRKNAAEKLTGCIIFSKKMSGNFRRKKPVVVVNGSQSNKAFSIRPRGVCG